MPGYKADSAELAMGKDLVVRLRSLIRQASESSTGSVSRHAPSHLPRNPSGTPDAVEQFTRRSRTPVRADAPAASGIYGASNAREWIYIGETDNIQASLLNDQRQGDSALMKRCATRFIFEPRSRAGRLATPDRLILEYEPVCNRRLRNGTGGPT